MADLVATAPAFLKMAHEIVWCSAATVTADGQPRSRVLHPIWEWDGSQLTGWIATSPLSPKAADLKKTPHVSCTYWAPTQDTCTAECDAEWLTDDQSRSDGWSRFVNGPAGVAYDPSMIPGWTSPAVEAFGILQLTPRSLRVMPGTLMTQGTGELLTWKR